jgi:aryl carrier-like protein
LIALIINAHQFERDGIDVEFVSLYRTSILADGRRR